LLQPPIKLKPSVAAAIVKNFACSFEFISAFLPVSVVARALPRWSMLPKRSARDGHTLERRRTLPKDRSRAK
jgi:hypothetical protein